MISSDDGKNEDSAVEKILWTKLGTHLQSQTIQYMESLGGKKLL